MSKKFDIAVCNPPYDGSLHLKILEKVIPYAEETINISPISAFQYSFVSGNTKKIDNLINNSQLEIAELIDCDDSTKLFGLQSLGSDLAIMHFKDGKTDMNEIYKDIVPNYKLANKVLTKIRENLGKGIYPLREVLTSKGSETSLKFVDGLSLKNHGGHGFSAFSCVSRNYTTAINYEKVSTHIKYVNFKTKEERDNAWKSMTSKFMRWVQKDVTQGSPDYKILFLCKDYTKPWDNKRFCDYFNITGYISDTEAEPDSEWEEILNTMKKYE